MTDRVRLFGLTIESEVPLPGLTPAFEGAAADVYIRRGTLVESEAGLVNSEVGSFAVRGGREIVVDARSEAPERNVRMYLLGTALGLLLHQRGLLAIHANAFALDGGVVAIAGRSGAGKSTLAAWLSRHGVALLGDDVLAIKVDEGESLAFPGLPRVRLWRESLEAFGLGTEGLDRSFLDVDYDKWDLPLAASQLALREMPLKAIYILEDGTEIAFRRLPGAASAKALFDHTYRGEYVEASGATANHWHSVTTLASSVPVFHLERPRDLEQLTALGRAVLAHSRTHMLGDSKTFNAQIETE